MTTEKIIEIIKEKIYWFDKDLKEIEEIRRTEGSLDEDEKLRRTQSEAKKITLEILLDEITYLD